MKSNCEVCGEMRKIRAKGKCSNCYQKLSVRKWRENRRAKKGEQGKGK